jgi:hypothetical protein
VDNNRRSRETENTAEQCEKSIKCSELSVAYMFLKLLYGIHEISQKIDRCGSNSHQLCGL